mmetsp:Transcript_26055/g.39438  ORF Transcript_26055/g.39438 Transcript_26055/m.39438 type:complete len:173 (+) Transcript_26055:211-729(+)|eukprot:CAMPEP_0178917718 /NCGR_PEP_ID=MMETSP0786-20121207/13409_1 /TAXON_ID=186022 /ORGANISM="Thalassionema frauenfeldii, Strain CCMP 1798" /LENGTH=172 /DNA_ID=CAMNT_0020591313 /DNA_START=148 /DNA_END=666 /DNA_ORIENTATION=-
MGATCSKNSKISKMELLVDAQHEHDTGEQKSTSILSQQNSDNDEFSIFDGNDISSDSPWNAFLSEGVDDDYNEHDDVAMFKAAFHHQRQDLDLYEDEAENETQVSQRSSAASIKEQLTTRCRRRHSHNSINSINSNFSSCSNFSNAGSISDDFAPATRRRGLEIASKMMRAI